ncbi:inner membrane protein YpjD [Sutterella sp.]|uniref:cytochrome C assembly family protein n=1 Tax=Sutterella sp. TaxID=1981025 RepID=UPI0026DF9455|nr:cytochrome c biogenesis protein CcsA [Sutterella sp.]MDO5531852.1 cytochrome c biogenesis protein CcsA [Sutterella sp.]
MSVQLIFTGLAALLYLAAGIAIVTAMKKGADARASSLIRWPVLLGLIMHGLAIQGEMFQPESVHFGFGYAVSVMFFFAVIILLIESWVHRLHAQFGIVLIAAAFGAVFPAIFQGSAVAASGWTALFRWHLLTALAAYSFMVIALVHAILMSIQNRQLKSPGTANGFIDSLPGLIVMERIFFRIVGCGFVLLTLVLIMGAWVTKEAYGVFFQFDHKMILTWISWIIFGVLLLGRWLAGWRARTALRLFWAGFIVFVVAYFCYSFIVEVFL